jgi:chromosome segregation ATPase
MPQLPAAIRKLEASIAEDAKTIAKKREKQAKAEKSSEGLKAEADKAEAETQQVTAAQEKAVSELKSLKKELRGAADKMGAARVKLTQLENDMDQQRGQRQRIFQRARLEEVTLPLATGDMDAADDGGDGGGDGGGGGKKPGGKKAKRKRGSSSDGAIPAPHVTELMASESFSPSGLVGTATMDGVDVDDEAAGSSGGGRSGGGDAGDDGAEQPVRIDFSSLDEHERAEDAATFEANLNSQIGDAAKQVEGMAPNMKALTQYEEVQARLHSMETEFDTSRSTAKSISQQFAAVQAKRYAAFMSAFKHIAEHIDDVSEWSSDARPAPLPPLSAALLIVWPRVGRRGFDPSAGLQGADAG